MKFYLKFYRDIHFTFGIFIAIALGVFLGLTPIMSSPIYVILLFVANYYITDFTLRYSGIDNLVKNA